MRERPDGPRGRPDAGGLALLLGAAAVVVLLVPVIGDSVAAVLAVGALVFGFIGIRRHEADRALRVWPAVLGAILGAMTLFVAGAMLLVTTFFD